MVAEQRSTSATPDDRTRDAGRTVDDPDWIDPAARGDAVSRTATGPVEQHPDGWLADDALFPTRRPIVSHRRLHGPTGPLLVTAIVIIVGAFTWVLVNGWGRSVPQQVVAPPPAAGVPSLGLDTTLDPSAPAISGASASAVVPSRPAPQLAPSPVVVVHLITPPPGQSGPTVRTTVTLTPAPPPAPPTATKTVTPTHTPTTPATRTPTAPTVVTNPSAGLLVRVVNIDSGESMAVLHNSTSDGAPIVQSPATGSAQQWQLVSSGSGCFQLVNQYTHEALDNPDGSYDDGTQMQQWSFAPGNINQTWCFYTVGTGRFSIQNRTSGSLLDLRNGGDDGAIQQWGAEPYAPDSNQTWEFIRVG